MEVEASAGSNACSEPDLQNPSNGDELKPQDIHPFLEEIDSSSSTPFVSAPSSPGRGPVGFFHSAPASPMHFVLTSEPPPPPLLSSGDVASVSGSFEFEFSARFAGGASGGSGGGGGCGGAGGSMCSADELFLNGQIRPMKLSTHLQRPQVLAPLLDLEEGEMEKDAAVEVEAVRGRDLRLRDRSLRRRTRSMSPLRSLPFRWRSDGDEEDAAEDTKAEEEAAGGDIGLELQRKEEKEEDASVEGGGGGSSRPPSMSASSSRSSSAGRNSRRWIFLKDFLYRSKSEGRSSTTTTKFWSSIAFSQGKEKERAIENVSAGEAPAAPRKEKAKKKAAPAGGGKVANGVGKRRAPSPHELHYTANRAQAEEMRKKTFLPYRQGLLGCLGFSSRSYGAINGFARALNPVSSR